MAEPTLIGRLVNAERAVSVLCDFVRKHKTSLPVDATEEVFKQITSLCPFISNPDSKPPESPRSYVHDQAISEGKITCDGCDKLFLADGGLHVQPDGNLLCKDCSIKIGLSS